MHTHKILLHFFLQSLFLSLSISLFGYRIIKIISVREYDHDDDDDDDDDDELVGSFNYFM